MMKIAVLLLGAVQFAAAAEYPNIVLILADDLGYGDIGVYALAISQWRADTAGLDWFYYRGTSMSH